MKIPSITFFKAKKQAAGWFAIGLGLHGIYLAKIRLAGAMPHVERCEYHETGTVTAALLEKLRREADIGEHDVAR